MDLVNKLMDHLSHMPEADSLELWELKGISRKLVRLGWGLEKVKPAGGVKHESVERGDGADTGNEGEAEAGA